jgi:curved DNA-binding protein CbpA
MLLKDYYVILGVKSDATLEQIKQAYRRLVRLHHPDLNKDAQDDRIKQLNEAYAVLGNAAKRVAYDIQRLEELRRALILEMLLRQREQLRRHQAQREQKMTWTEGLVGFVREFKDGLRGD